MAGPAFFTARDYGFGADGRRHPPGTAHPHPPDKALCERDGRRRDGPRRRAGKDADILLLTEDLMVDTVVARGRIMVRDGCAVVRGPFEERGVFDYGL